MVYRPTIVRLYNWRAGASQPSRTTGTIFLVYIYWRAGASQPSRTTGTIFLYVYWRAGASQPSRTTGTIFLYNIYFRCTGAVPGYPVFADTLQYT